MTEVREALQPKAKPSAAPEQRYEELDSLRGIAALTVVLHHFRMMWFWHDPQPRWLVAFNPVTAGHEAVMLFFLLSGFVLSIPNLRGKGQRYPVYLVRRILRIYAPYFFALAIAVVGAAIWHGSLGRSGWVDKTWLHPVNPRLVLEHVAMVGNYDWAQYNTAFWSLVIEMRMSIVFPLLYLLMRRVKPGVGVIVAVLLEVIGATLIKYWPTSEQTTETVLYAGVFAAGIVLATEIERVSAWYRGLRSISRWGLGLVAFVFYTFGHHIFLSLRSPFGLDTVLMTLGAAGYMVTAMNAQPIRAMLHTAWARFLGRISYSWYLVHGTVLFALTHALGYRVPVAAQFAIYFPATVLVAYGFYRAVEEPFLRVSRRVGKSAWARNLQAREAERSSIAA